jgi:uncharacterized protein (DUF169 family)
MDYDIDFVKKKTEELIEVLNLIGKPISITYTDKEVKSVMDKPLAICHVLNLVRSGGIICIDEDKCSCPGGKWHMGFGEKRQGLEKRLVEGEKLWCSVAVANQSIAGTHNIAPPPLNLSKYIVFAPLDATELKPDLVVIFANPFQASRLIFLADYHGFPIVPHVNGSLCWSAITYPLVSGNFNITMGDPTARRSQNVNENELYVSIPYRMFPGILDAMEKSTAGKGEPASWFGRRN